LIISPTRTQALAASIAILISVCGFSRGITLNAGILITVMAGHNSESLAAPRGVECFRKFVGRTSILEDPE
jgi:hypothetical protein